jgi:hypothetical protein
VANTSRWSYRVKFSFKGRDVRLESAVKLEMLAPPSLHLEGAEKESGSWFVIEDANGRPLYRRHMGNPFSGEREVLGADREFGRVKVPATEGTIVLLIPDLPGAQALAIHASETEGERAHQAAARVATVSLQEVAALAARQGGEHGR